MKNYNAVCQCVYCVKEQIYKPLFLCKLCTHFVDVYLENGIDNDSLGVVCETESGNVIDGKWIPSKET